MGSTPFRILQRIAGGIFGMHSRDMGWISAAIGLVCHFAVAFGAATVYYFASRKLRLLVERPVLCGLFYGELVFLFMYFVVIPLSAIGHPQYNIATYITGPIGHPLSEAREADTRSEDFTSEPVGVKFTPAPEVDGLWAEVPGADRSLLYFFGGGFVLGSPDTRRKTAGHLAVAAKARVLVPNYRLAP